MSRLVSIFAILGAACAWPLLGAGTVTISVDSSNFPNDNNFSNPSYIGNATDDTVSPTGPGVLVLTATGSGNSTYRVASNVPWMTVISGGSGTITAGGGSVVVNILVADPKLHANHTYTGQISFSGSNLASTPAPIPVSLNIPGVDVTAPSPIPVSVTHGAKMSSMVTVNTDGFATINVAPDQSWLTVVGSASGVNIGQSYVLRFQVDATNLTAGASAGTLKITCTGTPCQEVDVVVAVTVNSSATIGPIPSVTFNATAGGPNPPDQMVSISTSDGSSLPVTFSTTPPNVTWLSFARTPSVPATLDLQAFIGNMPANTYSATVTLTPANGTPAVTFQVTLFIAAAPKTAAIVVDQTSLAFSASAGGSSPASQTFHVTSSDGSTIALGFSQSVSTGGSWLSYIPSSNTTPAMVTVTATLGSLGPGTYTGSITVTPGNGTTAQVVSVTFLVGAGSPQLQLSDNSQVSLSAAAGSSTCNSTKAITITSSIPSQVLALTFTSSVNTPQGGSWLSASVSQPSTPATLTVACSPSGLAIGGYLGSVTIASPAASNPPITLTVSLSITGIAITPLSNASAASRLSPNMIVSVYGNPIAASSADGIYPNTSFGGTSATVTDSAGVSRTAALFALRPTQINLLIPAASALGNGTLTINQNGSPIASANIVLYDYAPGLYTATSAPDGPAAASGLRNFNGQNTPINVVQCSASGCAPVPVDTSLPGTVVLTLYGTGIHTPNLADVSCRVGSASVPVRYAGPQGSFTGLEQVNIEIPGSLAGAGDQTVTCSVNGQATNSPHINIK